MNINEMSLQECIDTVRIAHQLDLLLEEPIELGDILRQLSERIHELTRWIPVGERLPNKEDADNHNSVLIREIEVQSPSRIYHYLGLIDMIFRPDYFYKPTHWKRIDP